MIPAKLKRDFGPWICLIQQGEVKQVNGWQNKPERNKNYWTAVFG